MAIVNWIRSFLSNRRTSILLQEGAVEEHEVATGILQGSRCHQSYIFSTMLTFWKICPVMYW
jgi:hypothetical protein